MQHIFCKPTLCFGALLQANLARRAFILLRPATLHGIYSSPFYLLVIKLGLLNIIRVYMTLGMRATSQGVTIQLALLRAIDLFVTSERISVNIPADIALQSLVQKCSKQRAGERGFLLLECLVYFRMKLT